MALFDKFNEENFNVDNQQLEILPTTFSELKKFYSLLGSLQYWPEGEQTARLDGKIISRSYKTLSFATAANDFDLIDAGFVDPEFNSRYYWRVLHQFTETEYYSECGPDFENFKLWDESKNVFQMEIIYYHKEIASFTWNRPRDIISNSGIGCPGGLPDAPTGETGAGPWFSVGSTTSGVGENATVTTTCNRYSSLPKPFYLVYDAGKALGATISADMAPTAVYVSESNDINQVLPAPSTNAGSFTDPHRMSSRYLIIKWDDPGRTDLTNATIKFYGEENYRSFLPVSRGEAEMSEHSDTTPYIEHAPLGTPTRYKPPGLYNFPDNFWNDTSIDEITDFASRQVNPSS